MKVSERVLLGVDAWPAGALLRVLAGSAVLPLASFLGRRALGQRAESGWGLVLFFLAVLAAFRVVPAVARKVLRFPKALKDVWWERRQIAKEYDSYQWRKLTWFGVGLAIYIIATRRFDSSRWAILSRERAGNARLRQADGVA